MNNGPHVFNCAAPPESTRALDHKEDIMTYKVFTGPPGSGPIPPLEKDRWLFKEFVDLDKLR